MPDKCKAILLKVPEGLRKEMKSHAAMRGVPVAQVWVEAATQYLKDRAREVPHFCGADYCDDPACGTHGRKEEDR